MAEIEINPEAALRQTVATRSRELLADHQDALWRQTDRLFAVLFVLQWITGIIMAIWLSPRAWEGLESHVHPHIWAAVFLGGVIAIFPITLAIVQPGKTMTRMVIAVAQMLHSALLIHLSGGRIETHFHVFGSLAFLSFYRDWRVLVPATIVVALDHAVRGTFWPESVFGIVSSSPWRWIEHAVWVAFEDVILVWSCVRGARELGVLALRQAELETTNQRVEAEVQRQTNRLESVTQELCNASRRAGMAEIATGVLHNVGNVLNSVNVSVSVAMKSVQNSEVSSLIKAGDLLREHSANLPQFIASDERGKLLPGFLLEVTDCLSQEQVRLLDELRQVVQGVDHIKHIVADQQKHAKDGTVRQRVVPAELMEQAVAMAPEIGADPTLHLVRQYADIPWAAIDKHKALQILINLLSNAIKAVSNGQQERRIVVATRLDTNGGDNRIQFEISDNGVGIAEENLTKIFAHGFTTGNSGHGFGLHSSANAAREMGGNLRVSSSGAGHGASFILELPWTAEAANEPALRGKAA